MPVQVQGVAELVGRMKSLPDKLRNKGMRSAMKAAARPIVQATKSLAPVQTGLLRQSVASVVVKSKDSYSALIGMRHTVGSSKKGRGFRPSKKVIRAIKKTIASGGASRSADPARYAHLVEFGHNIVTRSGKGHGRVAAKPFMRPGLQSAASSAEQILARELGAFLEQEAGK